MCPPAATGGLGSPKVREPMNTTPPPNQKRIDHNLIEDICQINKISLGEGVVSCDACGHELREGDRITAYAFRPARMLVFEIEHVTCDEHSSEHPEFTIGRRELIVAGRIGLCSDVATQSSWPVLLKPDVQQVSKKTTTAARVVEGAGDESKQSSAETAPIVQVLQLMASGRYKKSGSLYWREGWWEDWQ